MDIQNKVSRTYNEDGKILQKYELAFYEKISSADRIFGLPCTI